MRANGYFLALGALALGLCGTLHAAVMFGIPTGTIDSTGGGTTGGTASGETINGGQGVSVFGMATLQDTSLCPSSASSACVFDVNGLVLDWSGSGSGTFSTSTLPADWDFTISGPGTSSSSWTLTFTINPDSKPTAADGAPDVTTFTGDVGAGGGTVNMPLSSINVPNDDLFVAYDVNLEVDTDFANPTDVMTVTVPGGGSIDIDPASTVPEPASFMLGAIGFAALLCRKTLAGLR